MVFLRCLHKQSPLHQAICQAAVPGACGPRSHYRKPQLCFGIAQQCSVSKTPTNLLRNQFLQKGHMTK